MELGKKISHIIKAKNLTKREFAKRLIEQDVISARTGDVLSEKIIYSYLDGKTTIRAELIPYIANVLSITEQELFDDSEQKRIKLLRHILKNPTDKEKNIATAMLNDLRQNANGFPVDFQLKQFAVLLPYAPAIVVDSMLKVLEKYKSLYNEFENEQH